MSDSYKEAEQALRPVGGVEEVQVVGALSETVARHLGLRTAARSVWLHPSVAHHIQVQRGLGRGDADFVLSHLPAAILRPHYCGADPRAGGRFDLVHLVERERRALFVALKLVAAGAAQSAQDEIWVSTAHPLPDNFAARKRYRDSLSRLPDLP